MLTAERELLRTRALRSSPRASGFSLGEAARIRQAIIARAETIECPRCAGQMGTVQAGGPGEETWFAGCADCNLSVIVDCRAGDFAGR